MAEPTTYHVKLAAEVVKLLQKRAERERRTIHNLLQILIETALRAKQ